ncbi:MAG: hypothetical protein IPM29_31460 [Planctomycetes bacterium]|nr:hypothetical protein [Planctomycetota bacterium]
MARRSAALCAALVIAGLAGCEVVPSAEAQLGFARLSVSGDVGLEPSGGGTFVRTDVDRDLGLGDAANALYGHAQIETVAGNVSVGGFIMSEDGRGSLSQAFGDIPAGTQVDSELDLRNLKAFYSYDLVDVGPVRLAPGIGIDLFDVNASVRSVGPVSAFEEVDVFAPVPMLFVEGEVELSIVSAEVEVGAMSLDLGDVDGTFLDAEARVVVTPTPFLDLFAGYRYLSIDADGRSEGDRFSANLEVQGFFIGGGVRF